MNASTIVATTTKHTTMIEPQKEISFTIIDCNFLEEQRYNIIFNLNNSL
jgi:hypothetical protein